MRLVCVRRRTRLNGVSCSISWPQKSIDLRGIEIDDTGIIYLNCPDINFDAFSELMAGRQFQV